MVANLVEGVKGFNYLDCLNSLQFLTQHCFDSNRNQIRISPVPFFQISSIIFETLPTDFDKETKKISTLFESFRSFNCKPNISKEFYEFAKSTLNKHEQNFSQSLTGLIEASKYRIEKIHPDKDSKFKTKKLIEYFESESYSQHLSLRLLKLVAKQLNITLAEQELQNRAYFLRNKLPLSTAFPQWILCKVIKDNIDMNSKKSKAKRWNWVWDYQISFMISQNYIDKKKIIIVTSDKEIVEVINSKGLQDNVMNVHEYLNFLNIP